MGFISPFSYSHFPAQPELTDGAAIARNFLRTVLPTNVPTPPQQGFEAAPIAPLGTQDSFTTQYAPEIYRVALESQNVSLLLMGLLSGKH